MPTTRSSLAGNDKGKGKDAIVPFPKTPAKSVDFPALDEEEEDDDESVSPLQKRATKGKGKAKEIGLPTPATAKVTRPNYTMSKAESGEEGSQDGESDEDEDEDEDDDDYMEDEEDKDGEVEEGDIAELDPLQAIEDDTFIPEEGEVEADEEDEEIEEAHEVEGPSRPRKRARMEPETGEDLLEKINRQYAVADDDIDMMRFQQLFRAIIERLCAWARREEGETITEWFHLPQERREMTRGFRSFFIRWDHAELSNLFLQHMPRMSQKVLGKKSLKPMDLLQLPAVPSLLRHRLTYLDVAIRVGRDNIMGGRASVPSSNKHMKPGTSISPSMDSGVYTGSTIAREGGHKRITCHQNEINKPGSTRERSKHYDFARHEDVAPNFRIAGIFTNPYAVSEEVIQDLERTFAPLLEGIIMVFLGTIRRASRVTPSSVVDKMFTVASQNLVNSVRQGLDLPDFSSNSLNTAWPLLQGVAGGMTKVTHCGNENCRKPASKAKSWYDINGPGSSKVCQACKYWFHKYGIMRTPEGTSAGTWPHENKERFIESNEEWFAAGNPRQCSNQNCHVQIHPDATIYGAMKAIRCQRCDEYCRKNKEEWSPIDIEDQNGPFDCKVCKKGGAQHHWDEDEVLCNDCNSIRCSFGKDEIPVGATSGTILRCANAGCCSIVTRIQGPRNYVEDLERQLWRCLGCDWIFAEFGIEAPAGYQEPIQQGRQYGPIGYHRYNVTKCIDCGRYATPGPWSPHKDGGYRCALCAELTCANSYCTTHPTVAITSLEWQKHLEASFCFFCIRMANINCKKKDAKDRWHFFYQIETVRHNGRIRQLRSCAICSKTESMTGKKERFDRAKDLEVLDDVDEPLELKYRCNNCRIYKRKHGVERQSP